MTKEELRSVLPGGCNHETAMKWAADDAAVLQCAHIDGDIWQSVTKPPPSHVEPFCADRKWRIKPQVLRYRVALMNDQSMRPYLLYCEHQGSADQIEAKNNFIRWHGDWQEVEL